MLINSLVVVKKTTPTKYSPQPTVKTPLFYLLYQIISTAFTLLVNVHCSFVVFSQCQKFITLHNKVAG